MTQATLNRYGRHRAPTERQLEVAAEIIRCGSQAEAASRLGISVSTLKKHVAELIARTESTAGFLGALTVLGWLWVPGMQPPMNFTTREEWAPGWLTGVPRETSPTPL